MFELHLNLFSFPFLAVSSSLLLKSITETTAGLCSFAHYHSINSADDCRAEIGKEEEGGISGRKGKKKTEKLRVMNVDYNIV